MRVAIEAASLSLTSGGLARYTSELSLALGRTFPEDEFYLISDQPFAMPAPAPANLLRGGGPRNTAERRWWLWGMARELSRLHADVIHGPDFAVPYLARRPSELTLHDLSPWMDERWHHAAQRVRRRTPLLLDLGLATMVITPGEKVRRAAIERFRLAHTNALPDNVEQLAPTCCATVPADPFDGKHLRYKTHGGSYVVYSIGTDGQDDGGVAWDFNYTKTPQDVGFLVKH